MAGAGSRFFRLAGMTASIAGKSVSHAVRSRLASDEDREAARSRLYEEIGLQLADTLGQMKGAAMKVGQMVSQYQDLFPPELAQAVAKLQQSAPPMPFEQIRQQVEQELGQPLSALFSQFEPVAFAAASIGQVHRAILRDGQPVVVKVQYPGVAQSCESDLKQMRLALRLMGLIKVDRATQDALFHEMRSSLLDELDYTREAHQLQVFAAFHAQLDDKLIIPRVYPELSSQRVLTLSEEQGDSMATASGWPPAVRQEIAERLCRFLCQEVFYLNQFHCDPHPGNFAFRPDGTVIVYDFGATKSLTPDTVQQLLQLLNAARRGDVAALEQQLRQLGSRNDRGNVPAAVYQQWLDLLMPVLRGPYNFADGLIHRQAVGLIREGWPYADCFRPVAELMMLNRAASGTYWNLAALQAGTDLSPLVQQVLGEPA